MNIVGFFLRCSIEVCAIMCSPRPLREKLNYHFLLKGGLAILSMPLGGVPPVTT